MTFRWLKEYSDINYIIESLPFKASKGIISKVTKDISETSFDVSEEYIAFGTNNGSVYLYCRSSHTVKRLETKVKATITAVRLLRSVDYLVAAGTSAGHLFVLEIPTLLKSKEVQLYPIKDVHDAAVTSLCWSQNGMRLFSGDYKGGVILSNLDYSQGRSESTTLCKESHSIVQLDYKHKILLVSTRYRTLLCDLKQGSTLVQIGHSIRKKLGNYGACFSHTSHVYERPEMFSVRPGMRLWKFTLHGQVDSTIIYKNEVKLCDKAVELLPHTARTTSSEDHGDDFGPLIPYTDDTVLTFHRSTLYMLNTANGKVEMLCRNLGNIISVVVCKEEVYVFRQGERPVILLSTRPVRIANDSKTSKPGPYNMNIHTTPSSARVSSTIVNLFQDVKEKISIGIHDGQTTTGKTPPWGSLYKKQETVGNSESQGQVVNVPYASSRSSSVVDSAGVGVTAQLSHDATGMQHTEDVMSGQASEESDRSETVSLNSESDRVSLRSESSLTNNCEHTATTSEQTQSLPLCKLNVIGQQGFDDIVFKHKGRKPKKKQKKTKTKPTVNMLDKDTAKRSVVQQEGIASDVCNTSDPCEPLISVKHNKKSVSLQSHTLGESSTADIMHSYPQLGASKDGESSVGEAAYRTADDVQKISDDLPVAGTRDEVVAKRADGQQDHGRNPTLNVDYVNENLSVVGTSSDVKVNEHGIEEVSDLPKRNLAAETESSEKIHESDNIESSAAHENDKAQVFHTEPSHNVSLEISIDTVSDEGFCSAAKTPSMSTLDKEDMDTSLGLQLVPKTGSVNCSSTSDSSVSGCDMLSRKSSDYLPDVAGNKQGNPWPDLLCSNQKPLDKPDVCDLDDTENEYEQESPVFVEHRQIPTPRCMTASAAKSKTDISEKLLFDYSDCWTDHDLPQPVKDISAGSSLLWAVCNRNLLHYSKLSNLGLNWVSTKVPAHQIVTSASGCIVWRLYNAGVYAVIGGSKRNPTGEKWMEVAKDVQHIAVDNNTAWYIKLNGDVLMQRGLTRKRPCFSVVRLNPQHGVDLRQIYCGHGSVVWALNKDNRLLVRCGINAICSEGKSWDFLSTPGGSIVVDVTFGFDNSAWVLCVDGGVWFTSGVTSTTPHGSGVWWQVSATSYLPHSTPLLPTHSTIPTPTSPSLSSARITASSSGVWISFDSVSLKCCYRNITGHRWYFPSLPSMAPSTRWHLVAAPLMNHSQDSVWVQQPSSDLVCLSRSSSDVGSYRVTSVLAPVLGECFVSLCVTSHTVWGLMESGDIYIRHGITHLYPQGHQWTPLDLSQLGKKHLRSVCCGDETVWSCDTTGEIHFRLGTGAPTETMMVPVWIPVDGATNHHTSHFTSVVCSYSDKVVWAVDNKGCVYARKGITDTLPIGTCWQHVPGLTVVQLAISNSCVYALDTTYNLYMRYLVSEASPTGQYWKHIPATCTQISACPDGTLWSINSEGHLNVRETTTLISAFSASQQQQRSSMGSQRSSTTARSSSMDEEWEFI